MGAHSSGDGVNEEKLPQTLTTSEASYRHETADEKATTYATEAPKQDSAALAKREDTPAAEMQLPSTNSGEEQRPVSLSPQQSQRTQIESTRVSASLPRSYQKTDTARLTSVVTARPFGSQSRGLSSLPRSYTVNKCSQLVYSVLESKLLVNLCRGLNYVHLVCEIYI